MWPVFPASLTLVVIGAMLLLVLSAMRVVQPEWWSSRPARALVLAAFGGMLFGLTLWGAGRAIDSLRLVHAGAGIAYVGVLVVLPAAVVMPAAALLDRVLVPPANAPAWRRKLSAPRTEVSRRALIRFGSASLPAMAAIGGASGFVQARRAPTMPVVRLRWPGLHPDLLGLRILHLSDLHLGACLGLDDLKRGLEIARAAHETWQIPLEVLSGDPLAEEWVWGAVAAVGRLLS